MIAIDNLTSHYPGTPNGLSDFSCEFPPGIYALLGKNGSGKTTLFRNLIGAIFPQKGSCQLWGERAESRNPEILKEIFLIPEEPFFPDISPQHYTRALSPFYPRFQNEILSELLNRWEVPPTTRLLRQSQGQKKKFLIAFAMATRCRLMLFDEPTNGLDIVSKLIFKNLGTQFFQPDQTYIFATHQIKDVENLINHITLIDRGRCWGSYDLERLRERFFTTKSTRDDPQAVYSLKGMGGLGGQSDYLLLKERKGKKKGKGDEELDLELFFTAFIQDPEKIQSIPHA